MVRFMRKQGKQDMDKANRIGEKIVCRLISSKKVRWDILRVSKTRIVFEVTMVLETGDEESEKAKLMADEIEAGLGKMREWGLEFTKIGTGDIKQVRSGELGLRIIFEIRSEDNYIWEDIVEMMREVGLE